MLCPNVNVGSVAQQRCPRKNATQGTVAGDWVLNLVSRTATGWKVRLWVMMTSWHEDTHALMSTLWGESTGHRWIYLTQVSQCRALVFSLLHTCNLNTPLNKQSRVADGLKSHGGNAVHLKSISAHNKITCTYSKCVWNSTLFQKV